MKKIPLQCESFLAFIVPITWIRKTLKIWKKHKQSSLFSQPMFTNGRDINGDVLCTHLSILCLRRTWNLNRNVSPSAVLTALCRERSKRSR